MLHALVTMFKNPVYKSDIESGATKNGFKFVEAYAFFFSCTRQAIPK